MKSWYSNLSKTGRRVTIALVAIVALIIVSEIYNVSTGRNLLGATANPLAKCESEIQADAQYVSWDGSLPAYCTGKTNGNFTLNDQQLQQATDYADGLIANLVPGKTGSVPYPG